MDVAYKGRFAPSPSGPLHFGSILAAMASYCDARAAKGRWLVRIEDIDAPRSRDQYASDILSTLNLYGFEWDQEVVWQSERTSLYRQALTQLSKQGLIYPCSCSRKMVDAAYGDQASAERIYPGTCRHRSTPLSDVEQVAWRMKVPDASIEFDDRLQGHQQQQLSREVGDFVLRRADDIYTYQLAVVVDDAEQGISHVVRGADLLASTPRQIWLQQCLGLATPCYLHIPVAMDGNGKKLSKQTLAQAVTKENAVEVLLAAWSFLDQIPPKATPGTPTAFWLWAHAHWQTGRLPSVQMLPAPSLASKQDSIRD